MKRYGVLGMGEVWVTVPIYLRTELVTKNLWGIGSYGLGEVWVKEESTVSEEIDPAFIDDAADEYYASDYLGYLHNLLFYLSHSTPYCHTRC